MSCLMPLWRISCTLTQTCLTFWALSSCLQGISIGWFGVRVFGSLSLCVRKCFPIFLVCFGELVFLFHRNPPWVSVLLRSYIWSLRLRWVCPNDHRGCPSGRSTFDTGLECLDWCLSGGSLAFSRKPVSPSVRYPLVFKGFQSIGLEYESLVFFPYA